MRRSFITIFLILLVISLSGAAEPDIELIPSARLGFRGHVQVREVEWLATHPKLGGKVTVCEATREDPQFGKTLIPLGESYGMTRTPQWRGSATSPNAKSKILYQKDEEPVFMQLDPTADGRNFFSLRIPDRVLRDPNGNLILKGMPDRQKALEIALSWLKKLGISEDNLARDPEGPRDLDVQLGGTTETGLDTRLGKEVISQISLRMTFPCVIGGIPAFWNGFGGCYIVELGDGGEFTRADWCVRPSTPIGEFQLLSRDELTHAIQQGFCWVNDPLEADRIEITKIQLLAYHGRDTDKQKHFSPIWLMTAQPSGKQEDAVSLYIPALKQHRDKYGPVPAKVLAQ